MGDLHNDYTSHEVHQSEHDSRVYKYISLPNKLRVLLISDDSTEKAAASLDVHIGSLTDPDDIPGLAHFCEHMLFLGTKKYPVENDFTQYLSEHGGRSNAYTNSEHTCYYFDVRHEALPGALDRFSQFLLSPLFDAGSKEREVQAIDSEHQKNINNDHRRLDRVDRLTSKEGHVYRKFATGNLNTLQEEPAKSGVDIREELLKFHSKYYSANIMTLAVLGKESIDEMEKLVVPLFKDVVNKDVEIPSWTEHPYGEKEFGLIAKVVSIKEMRTLKLRFPLPDLHEFYESKPDHYVMHLIGHEGEGSLLSLLKKQSWVNQLYAGPHSGAKGFQFFSIGMELSEEGMKHTDEIIGMAFQYIKLITETEPMEWVFNEMKMLDEIQFRFKDKQQPTSLVTKMVGNMHKYPAKDVLSGDYVLRTFKPDLIKDVLSHLTPQKLRYALVSQDFKDKTDLVDEIYGTHYSVDRIPKDKIEEWSKVALHPELKIPAPNPFIPDSLEVVVDKTVPQDKEKQVPQLVKDTELMRVWFKSDDTFFLPKACYFIQVDSPIAYQSPQHANHLSLYVGLVKDALAEYAYDAELAGINYSIHGTSTGIQISLSGYHSKQLVLLEKILQKITSFELKEERFTIFKEELRQSIMNIEAQQPYITVQELEQHLMEERTWRPEELMACLPDMTMKSLRAFIDEFLEYVYIEALIAGNVLINDVNKTIGVLDRILVEEHKVKPMLLLHHLRPREYILPDGCSYLFEQRNKIHHMTCVQTYLQFGKQETVSNVLSELLSQTMREPCFDTLRTKEQLGYIVSSGISRSRSAQGLIVLILSDKEPTTVENRIDTFLSEFETTITNMSDQEFGNHVQAVSLRKLEKPKRISQECHKYWGEISSKQYHFHRAKVEVEELNKITKQDLLDFYKRLVSPSSLKRHKVTLVVLGKDAESINSNEKADQKKWSVIDDVLSFKYSLPLFPLVPPYMDIPIVQKAKSKL